MGGLLLMLFLLHSCTNSAAAQKRKSNIISLGSYLTPTTDPSWFSPSGIFAFGFYQLQPNGNNYAVCISFAGFSERTVVWTANRDNPIVPDNVMLVLTGDGALNLQRRVSQYLSIINFDIASYSESIGSAAMLDNGNFVLYSLYDNRVIWQSFDHPTDTLLPGQRLTPGSMLLSRASQTDFAEGIFTLKMQTDGDLVQYPVDARTDTYEYAYYASNTAGGGFNVSLNLDNDGRLYLLNGSSTVLKNITRGGGTIHLLRIDVDGIFRLYRQSWDRRGDNNWRSIWSSTEDKCLPKGSCGLNSFCTYLNQTVDCKCLPGFDFIEAGNWTAGCARNFSVGTCANKDQGSLYEMTRVPNVDWKDNGYNIDNVIREEDCGRACLDDCYCDAAFFKDGWCRRQRLPLRYGRWLPIYPTTALVKVSRRASYNSGSKSRLSDLQKYVVTGVSLGIASLVISSIIVYYVKYRWHNRSNQHVDKFMLNHGSLSLKRYSYNKIKKMTKSLRDKLGKGGYGIVYKGNLPDTGQLVAVKVLTETSNNAEDFVNEVASISRTSHVNIVNLLGFCYERKKRALIYEFMPNGSLDKFIYKSTGSVDPERSLEQGKLYEIAVGIARGLEYLHRGCNTRIVHFDIKPQNILLDEDFCPKISDFGLAKLVKKKQSKISMLGARGTIGYIAPEVFSRNFGAVSHKSDVYSYGMMLLEMAEARKFAETEATQSSENYFPDKIYEYVLLKTENSGEEKAETKRKMLLIGLWCIQTAPSERPSMSKVVEMLEGSVEAIPIPPKPFLHSPILSGQQFSSSFSVIIETEDVIQIQD